MQSINTQTYITTSYGKVKGAARQYPYFQAAEYRRKTLKNGKTVWYYVSHRGTARRSSDLALKDAIALAEEEGCLYLTGIRHNSEIKED